MIRYKIGLKEELESLKSLLWKYGQNEWNYLTKEGVDEEFSLVEQGFASALIAADSDTVVGFAILIDGMKSPSYLKMYGPIENICFIGDVVVSSSYSGKGIATQLLKNCLIEAKKKDACRVLIERHEENLASAGMMRKAGFSVVDLFYDPDKRSSGSRNSVILQVEV